VLELARAHSTEAGTLQDWQLYELADPQIALELTPIAVAGGEAVGFGALRRIEGGKVGVHRIIVVQPTNDACFAAAICLLVMAEPTPRRRQYRRFCRSIHGQASSRSRTRTASTATATAPAASS
jgi:hypothetical protein